MIVNIDDDWKSSVFRDFEDLQAAWNVYSGRSDVVALIHVGITRPEIDLIDSALLSHKGFVFMTAAARWIFSERADFFDQEVCEINSIPTYAVINGCRQIIWAPNGIFLSLIDIYVFYSVFYTTKERKVSSHASLRARCNHGSASVEVDFI